jgi:ABC-2 type transport system ATP-binding protein
VSKIKGVKEAALFGATIHAVVYDSSLAIAEIKGLLSREKAGEFNVNKILPTLEDVFVSSIENYDQRENKKG